MTSTSYEQLGDEDASILPARIVQVLIRLVINPFEIVFYLQIRHLPKRIPVFLPSLPDLTGFGALTGIPTSSGRIYAEDERARYLGKDRLYLLIISLRYVSFNPMHVLIPIKSY